MKLSAQFTAACGTKFMVGLGRKEASNPLFEFLKPSSKNFAYFTALVDSYQKVIRPGEGEVERVLKISTVPGMLSTVALRKEYRREMRVRRMEEEGGGMSQAVDWHDFVIVETVDFDDKELEGGEEDDGMDLDESESEDEAVPEVDDGGEIKVVADYQPRVNSASEQGSDTMVDPITGERVKVAEMSEHMRIQLMDPKWREQNARFQSKLGSTNVASGESIVANLKAFSEERRDIFGSSVDREMERRMEERERGEEAKRILDKYKDTGKERATVEGPPKTQQPPQAGNMMLQQQQQHAQMRQQPPPPPQQLQQRLQPPRAGVPAPALPAGGAAQPRDTSARRGVSNLPAWMTDKPGVLPNPSEVNSAQPAGGGAEEVETLRGRSSIMQGRPRDDQDELEERERKKQRVQPLQSAQPVAQNLQQAMMPPPVAQTQGQETEGQGEQKLEEQYPGGIMPPDVFAATLESPTITVTVACIADKTANPSWNLDGRSVPVTLDVMDTVKVVKAKLSEALGMPANKMQMKDGKGTFLKDGNTMALLNFKTGTTVELVAKSRGGKKK